MKKSTMHATKIYLSDEAFKKFIEDNKGKSLKEIAQMIGYSRFWTLERMKHLKIKKPRVKNTWTKDRRSHFSKMRLDYFKDFATENPLYTNLDLAKKFGVNLATIINMRRSTGVKALTSEEKMEYIKNKTKDIKDENV